MITEKNMMHGVDYLGEDVAGWLMSEKLDGCRAFWDGRTMWSRGGKVINIPDAMRQALPVDVALDGEIHAARDGFERARRAVQYGQWVDGIEFGAFDAPGVSGGFEARYKWLASNLPDQGVVNYIGHSFCISTDDALSFLDVVLRMSGEGIMLRDPLAVYRTGRTDRILKLKSRPL